MKNSEKDLNAMVDSMDMSSDSNMDSAMDSAMNSMNDADAEADAEADAAAAVVSSGPFLASADAADAADGAHARRSNTRLGLWARLCLAARGEAACDWREHAQAIGGQV